MNSAATDWFRQRRLSVDEISSGHGARKQNMWHNRVTEPKPREQRFIQGSNVNHAGPALEALQRCERMPAVAKLAGVVVLDDPCGIILRPIEQLQPARHRKHNSRRKLLGRRDERRLCR
jgi:hypothetical protein